MTKPLYSHPATRKTTLIKLSGFLMLMTILKVANATTPQELIAKYEGRSAKASPTNGQTFFTTKHGKEWSCSSCHDKVPNHETNHIVTNKVIKPMSPNINAARFSDEAKVEKWFKRNCNDVVGRECTAQEKADVISWLLTVR
ncbi:MAG: DUF1924 domain-containing protein [Methylophilaceae bacterium]